MLKNGFLTFCCAFIPGAGQMYQGYMKRGLSLIPVSYTHLDVYKRQVLYLACASITNIILDLVLIAGRCV